LQSNDYKTALYVYIISCLALKHANAYLSSLFKKSKPVTQQQPQQQEELYM